MLLFKILSSFISHIGVEYFLDHFWQLWLPHCIVRLIDWFTTALIDWLIDLPVHWLIDWLIDLLVWQTDLKNDTIRNVFLFFRLSLLMERATDWCWFAARRMPFYSPSTSTSDGRDATAASHSTGCGCRFPWKNRSPYPAYRQVREKSTTWRAGAAVKRTRMKSRMNWWSQTIGTLRCPHRVRRTTRKSSCPFIMRMMDVHFPSCWRFLLWRCEMRTSFWRFFFSRKDVFVEILYGMSVVLNKSRNLILVVHWASFCSGEVFVDAKSTERSYSQALMSEVCEERQKSMMIVFTGGEGRQRYEHVARRDPERFCRTEMFLRQNFEEHHVKKGPRCNAL